jgi:hypothetical protein
MKFIGVCLLIVTILNSIPAIYLSYNSNLEIIKFCNKTQISTSLNLAICEKRPSNNSNQIYSISTENFRIYNNITNEIKLKNNINNSNDEEIQYKVDFNLLSLVTQITLFFVYLIFYNNFKNQANEVDIINLSPSDYTLMLSEFELPYDIKDFNQLKNYLETEVCKI